MKYQPIITVGRQYGSGGRYVAKLLADKLGIPFYDKELLAEASRESGICQELLENYDEKQGRNLLYALISGVQTRGEPATMYMDMPLNHKVFLAQFDAIRKIADQGPCVLVGRCADYVLRDHENVINVFVKASTEERVKRIIKYNGADPVQAEEILRKADKQRAAYYNYYATGNWGEVSNYDLCVERRKKTRNGKTICRAADGTAAGSTRGRPGGRTETEGKHPGPKGAEDLY